MLSTPAPQIDPVAVNPFGEDALAMAVLVARRAAGETYETIADTIGITPEGAEAMVAVFARMLRDALEAEGRFDRAEAEELAAGSPVAGGDPEFFMAVIEAWLTGKSYTELDAGMGWEPGTFAGRMAYFVVTIERDLRAHGCPVNPEAALSRAYAAEQQRQRPN
ncbi:hypothetical protein GXW71_21520 [Roseomonas hellenica]|uniref:Uncharacterized protein n=1 Tax=Plastoroseomonas hellenica TaxID=2687306 RepID=A0ABS5F357_9PROT|nr:hypothetical protein [Plastoroseomonas hellenica]MBR0666954.1 hypothetical protein [Plastoroseomonas hellenica]